MAFLYIGLGIAMVSGISAMMQIGNNVNNLMFLSTFKQSEYYSSSLPSYDRRILNFINDYTGPDSEVCEKIKENFNDTLYEDGEIFSTTQTQTPSRNPLFVNTCVLVNKDLNHRLLIKQSGLGTYSLFSCYLKDETFCPYEVNK